MEEVPEDEEHMWELLRMLYLGLRGLCGVQDPRGREFKERPDRKA